MALFYEEEGKNLLRKKGREGKYERKSRLCGESGQRGMHAKNIIKIEEDFLKEVEFDSKF